MLPDLKIKIFNISTEEEFNLLAVEIFRFQYDRNPVYQKYVNLVCKDINQIKNYWQIPFSPIEFFTLCGQQKDIYCITQHQERLKEIRLKMPKTKVLWDNGAFYLLQIRN